MSVRCVPTIAYPAKQEIDKDPVMNINDVLPSPTVANIFSYLSSKDLNSVSVVNKKWLYLSGGSLKTVSLTPSLLYSTRPKKVQEKIDAVYQSLTCREGYAWKYNGRGKFYDYLRIKDTEVIAQRIANASPLKKDLFFLDLGAGYFFGSVDAKRDFLRSKYKMSCHHFHVIGVTGEGAPRDKIEVNGNVTTHKISGFKIENLLQSFSRFKLDLVDSVEDIDCYWTLQHLVDPLGTLEQAYHLLVPGNGFLFGTGFGGESMSPNLAALFGWSGYIARRGGLALESEFALFRDRSPYHYSFGLHNFSYDYNEPLVDLSERSDSYAQCRAKVKSFGGHSSELDMPFGGGFYGMGTFVLEKLLGKKPKWIEHGSGLIRIPVFHNLSILKYYLNSDFRDFYELEIS